MLKGILGLSKLLIKEAFYFFLAFIACTVSFSLLILAVYGTMKISRYI